MPRTSSTRRKPAAASRRRGATMSQLRNDIDHGRTQDKVDFVDPAAVPLGTDEEAAGTPLPPEVIAQERRREWELGRAAATSSARRGAGARRWGSVAVLLAILAIAVVFGLRLGH